MSMFDVVEVEIAAPHRVRLMAVNKTEQNAEAIVKMAALLGITQNLIGLRQVFKLLSGFGIVGIDIGMVFARHAPIGFFYLLGRGIFLHPQYPVIVFADHVCLFDKFRRRCLHIQRSIGAAGLGRRGAGGRCGC